ncbi:MAG TPA: hypothetical protein EYO31_07360 [Phycisphaerales bacterium]|nr:hypothetical protein [Phycisphaerales bacterium]
MRIELTDDEATTIMVALDNYRDLMSDRFCWSAEPQDQEDAGSAEWCWQKIHTQREEQFNNSVADAVGEGETSNTNEVSASVDPYDLKGLE